MKIEENKSGDIGEDGKNGFIVTKNNYIHLNYTLKLFIKIHVNTIK